MVAASSLYGGAIIVPTSYEYKVIYIEITAPCRWVETTLGVSQRALTARSAVFLFKSL